MNFQGPEYLDRGIPQASRSLPEGPLRISGTMAMDSLAEQSTLTAEARAAYEAQRATRDDLIRDARSASIPVAALMRVTGLGRDRISKISSAPSRTETDR